MLTSDEVAFAGGILNLNNTVDYNYYLSKNAEGVFYFTMSPSAVDTSSSNVDVVGLQTFGTTTVESLAGIRPSISLKSWVRISSGDGTATNPYKVAV